PVSKVIDLALDPICDIFYILEKDTRKLFVYDSNADYLDWIQCIQFKNPRAIEAGKNDIYFLDGNNVIILAKVNFQTRRFFPNIGTDPIAMALGNKEDIFVLDGKEKQIYKISNTTGMVYALLNTDEERNALSGATAISIDKKDNNKIYILNSDNKQVI